MEISFTDLKEKEIVNVLDGKKLGRIIDILFDNSSGVVRGIVVPGEKRFFRKNDDIFVPLDKIRKIGNDVILVSLQVFGTAGFAVQNSGQYKIAGAGSKQSKKQNYSNIYNTSYENAMPQYLSNANSKTQQNLKYNKKENSSFVRFKRIDNKKYK